MASVNIEQVADVQTEAVDTSVQDSVTDSVEVAEPQGQEVETAEIVSDKPKQDSETNHKFAEMRREQEQLRKELAARDEWVTKTFGEYGVNTWADYQAQMEQPIEGTARS